MKTRCCFNPNSMCFKKDDGRAACNNSCAEVLRSAVCITQFQTDFVACTANLDVLVFDTVQGSFSITWNTPHNKNNSKSQFLGK